MFMRSQSKPNNRAPYMSNNRYHKGVTIGLNMQPAIDEMAKHFLRLIEQVNPLFLVKDGRYARTVQKAWYTKQLVNAEGETYGFIHFTVTNRSILKKDFDANDPLSEVKELEYSFHVKQTETVAHARNFTSGSLRYKNTWGEFAPDVVDFHLYGGTDIESGVMFRDLITEVKPQLETFSADKDTLIAQNRLDLIPFILG